MEAFSNLWSNIQQETLFMIEESLGSLTPKEQQLVTCLETCHIDYFISLLPAYYTGRKRSNRLNILKSFFVKALYALETTVTLIEMLKSNQKLRSLCGFESFSSIPSESTFSRAFAEFSEYNIANQIHTSFISNFLGDKLLGHISRDSTAIPAREKAVYKAKETTKSKYKKGRPKKGEVREIKHTALQLQLEADVSSNLANLPTECNFGTKKSSQGKRITWKGYKLHLDVADGDIPISAYLTSASLHDSQVAIPLSQISREKVTYCYELMDAAYDSQYISANCIDNQIVPIIDPNPRNGNKRILDPAEKVRYNQRASVERVNSYLKDGYGACRIRYRGMKKMFTSLMIGIILITVNQVAKLYGFKT